MKQKLLAFSLLIVLIFSACVQTAEKQTKSFLTVLNGDEKLPESFRDVSSLTLDEINFIEELQKQHRTIVYGMPLSTEAFRNDLREMEGFSALFCGWLTKFFGVKFQLVLYDWPDFISGFESGDISFTGELSPEDKSIRYDYMSKPIASRSLKYYRIAGSDPVSKITSSRLLKCGFIRGSSAIDTVTSELAPGVFEIIEISDVSAVYNELASGRIDVFHHNSSAEIIFIDHSDIVSMDFYPLTHYPVSLASNDPSLKTIIAVVDKVLNMGGIRFLTAMYNHGYQDYLTYKFKSQLTKEELAYLYSNPVIPIGIDPGNYPMSFFDTRDRKWKGISLDILKEISKLTDITFKYHNDENTHWPVIYQMLLDGDVALVPELARTKDREDMFIWPESLQMVDHYALISNSNFPNLRINEVQFVKVGLAKGIAHTDFFNKWFPNHDNNVLYESMEAALIALQKGEIEMVMADQKRLLYLTNYLEYPNFKANIIFNKPIDIRFGLNKNQVILCSIIDKALSAVDTVGISNQWLKQTYNYKLKLSEARFPFIIGLFALLFIIIILLSFLFMRNRNVGKKLESLVQERTTKLNKYQHELEFALQEARAANNSKSVFLANMSHEIRTPMNSIVGFSELAMDTDASPKTRDYLKNIQTNAEWLLQIINDILDISKIESGKMVLEKIPFDMHELFTSCRTLVMPKAVEKGIMLHFYAEPSVGKKPMGDPTRLRQIFVNLLSNAVKFTNSGIVKLISDITNMDERSLTINFEIKDSGIGMTPEQIEIIFDPFAQAETGTTRKYGGTGLGLPITKSIIEMMGGKLLVESAVGVGTKFSFELTFETIDVSVEEMLEKKIVFNEIKKPLFKGEVLLCEDNVMNQQVICEHLARVGLKTSVAENGKAGVDMVKSRIQSGDRPFDLIFMDMHMPVMDGLEASTEIIKLNTGIPIVAMTANIMADDREVYKANGMLDCVGKPFTSQELWRCLLKFLSPLDQDEQSGQEDDSADKDMEFNKTLKKHFYKNNQNRFSEISKALEEGDVKLAHRLVHTLKSNAGQINKLRLQTTASIVESHLKDGKNLVTEKQLTVLDEELNEVLSQLDDELGDVEDSPKSDANIKKLDKEAARQLLEKLELMLKMGNPESQELTADLRAVPGDETDIEKLVQLIEDFEFEPAFTVLAKIKQEIS